MARRVDLISDLTSSLLSVIVSFLPFKEAARTSILSKQWRQIWRETLNLDFNENFFVRPDEPEDNQTFQRTAFIDFVRQFIASYLQSVIKRFELTCSKPQDFRVDIENFIQFATSRNVIDFGLDFSNHTWRDDGVDNHDAVFELPAHVYQHRILESLKLFSCSSDISRFGNFNVLKNVSLGWIEMNMSYINGLLKSCPMLESLSLKKCWNIEHFEIYMTDLRLKKLVIDECDFVQDWFSIEGPKLQYFKYSGRVGHFHMENQRAMVEADLDFSMESEFEEEVGVLLYNLLQELFAVQVLTVCSVLLQIIPHGDEPIALQAPIGVKHLTLKTALHCNEFCGIMFMFKSCPLLHTLTIDIGPAKIFPDYEPPYTFNHHEFWSSNVPVHLCIRRTLKVVNVKAFRGTLNELYVLRYIIAAGRVMEQINLYVSNEDADNGARREELRMKIAQEMMLYHKASRNLRISVY